MVEKWRIFFKSYSISNKGRVRNKHGDILKQHKLRHGYMQINIFDNARNRKKTYRYFLVHRLVAENFLGGIPDGKEVNHKDGNKLNNSITNLEIVSRSQNIEHALRTGLHNSYGENSSTAKLTNREVKLIRKLSGIKSPAELAKNFGISCSAIRHILKRETWTRI